MPELAINPKFKTLLRPLSEDELQRLEWSVLKEGIHDSIKIWNNDGSSWIVDGHNRYGIYTRFPDQITGGFKTLEMKFKDEDEALEWIVENQLRRRNLTPNEKVLYLGRLFEMRKKRHGGLTKQEKDAITGSTAAQIAGEQDVSERTVTRAAEVAKAFSEADKELQDKFTTGEISQTELVKEIQKKNEAKVASKEPTYTDLNTAAMATIGERILRDIRHLRHKSDDFVELCKAIKADPAVLAPDLLQLATALKSEEKQAQSMTTLRYVKGLCRKPKIPTCSQCKGADYVTEAQFNTLKAHYGLDKLEKKELQEEKAA